MSSFISVNFESFNFFPKYFFSSFLKETFDVVFSLILVGRLLLFGMASAKKESVKKLIVLSYIEGYFFYMSCCFILMVERGSILCAGRSLLSKRKKYYISRERRMVIFVANFEISKLEVMTFVMTLLVMTFATLLCNKNY